MMTRSLPIVSNHQAAIRLIAIGEDMWAINDNPLLVALREDYLHQYAAVPTNTQFVERGVKESGYVTLGRRCKSNRTILAIARGKD